MADEPDRERLKAAEIRLAAAEDMNWRLTGRINALELLCAALFAQALAHEPKDKRVEVAQTILRNLKSESRRADLYDAASAEGQKLAKETSDEMDHIIAHMVEYLAHLAT